MGLRHQLEIGDLSARVDWGYAPDFTRAMRMTLEGERPEDFVIATGQTHSVRELLEVAASSLSLDWQPVVAENRSILRRSPLPLCGDHGRLTSSTGWYPVVSFEQMVRILVDAARSALERRELGLPTTRTGSPNCVN